MQTMFRFNTMAVLVLALLSNAFVADAMSLRKRSEKQGPVALSAAMVLVSKVHDDIDYEVLKKSSINKTSTSDCLCQLGSFWNWRIKACVKQGAWGYECGFFPAEHHKQVCQDGLKCVLLDQSRVKYSHPGAAPGSCQECNKEDNCLVGEQRHAENCLKEYLLSGSACQTIRVTVIATASATVTKKVTKSRTASATATATASHDATATEGGQSASVTKKATAEGQATVEAQASGKATAKAKATEKGVAEGKACVTVDEVKALLKLEKVSRMGAVLSSRVVSRGDEEAFDKAYAKALDAAHKAGLLNAGEAAKALAAAEAREHAAIEAEGKANEAAAWQAEAGAKKEAQQKAKADALAKAEAAATKEASNAAKVAGQAAADAAAAEDAAKGAKGQAGGDAAEEKAKAARAAADAAAKEAAEAKARQQAISDIVNPKPTQAPVAVTTAEPTNAPVKITKDQMEAKLP